MDLTRQPTQAEVTRFFRLIHKHPDGCWVFSGETSTKDGYQHFRPGPGQPRWMAHKFSYRVHKGPIEEGMQIDHRCHTDAVASGECDGGDDCPHRKCVNPAHLEMISAAENTFRQNHANRNKTHCPKGHPLEGDNVTVWADGKRRCRTCRNEGKKKKPPEGGSSA